LRKAKDRGQKSEGRSQRAEVRGQRTLEEHQAPTSKHQRNPKFEPSKPDGRSKPEKHLIADYPDATDAIDGHVKSTERQPPSSNLQGVWSLKVFGAWMLDLGA
jgi:hypothetical protein